MTKNYKIQFNKNCVKDLEKIPNPFRKNIEKRINELAYEPRPIGCKKLQGSDKVPLFRIRCGDYRIVYTIHDDVLLIVVIDIGHRREIYRGL
jgi:mRNA interferase RelE/StbE